MVSTNCCRDVYQHASQSCKDFYNKTCEVGKNTYRIGYLYSSRAYTFTSNHLRYASSECMRVSVLAISLFVSGFKIVSSSVVYNLRSATSKVCRFIKHNWHKLLVFCVAWGIVVAGVGLMYGFKHASLPLLKGFGYGLAFGVLTGIVTVKIDKDDKYKNNNTFWSMINGAINTLDFGTRGMVISVSGTVIAASTVIFPVAAGAAMATVIANHFTTKIGQDLDLGGSLQTKAAQIESKLTDLNDEIIKLRADLAELQREEKHEKRACSLL